MHNAAFSELGVNARYLACAVHPDHLAEGLEGARRMNFLGVNLTVPHKLLAVPMMAELHESAEKWGAVNTVGFEGRTSGGEWLPMRDFTEEQPTDVRTRGYNTDADGLLEALEQDVGLPLQGARVLLLGAGGAGRAAALLLAEVGVARLNLLNRTSAKAEALASEIASRCPETMVEVGYPQEENVDLIINATSLGLRPDDPLPLDLARFSLRGTKAVFDMVYRPAETPLIKHAAESGARAVNGLGMLLFQGTRAFEIWTGRPAPVQVMRTALENEVYEL